MIGIGVIGCGLIGTKRVAALGEFGQLVACTDLDVAKAQRLAAEQTLVVSNWQELLALQAVEAVVIATQHDSLVEITKAAIAAGKHVFVEKPAARSPQELLPVLELSRRSSTIVRVGFNHRYHRALQKAKQLVQQGALGELMFLRGRYGHGGRVGYEQEWRADVTKSGGGELIDQGPHLIDLSRWIFEEEFTEIQGHAQTYFWEMSVDDNAFLTLRTPTGKTAFLHVSCSEWKNLFSLEIYGKLGKLEISGLGGSYGIEKLTWYKMLPEMGPPETRSWEFPMADNSWSLEMQDFFEDIQQQRSPSASLSDAYEALKIIHQIYQNSNCDYCA
jgi:predicted dehydrogenase